jgi:uncharacterized protein YbcI
MQLSEPEGLSNAEESISREIATVHRESYGAAVRHVRTHVVDGSVLCVLDIDLLPHERAILDTDHGAEIVRASRKAFQETIGSTFIAAVEHATGRRVVGFLSETHIDPTFAVEYFRLDGTSEPE